MKIANTTTEARHNNVIDCYYDVLVSHKYSIVNGEFKDLNNSIPIKQKCLMVADILPTYHPGSISRIINRHNTNNPAEYKERISEAEERFFRNNPHIRGLLNSQC